MLDFNLFPTALKGVSFAAAILIVLSIATPFLVVGARIVA